MSYLKKNSEPFWFVSQLEKRPGTVMLLFFFGVVLSLLFGVIMKPMNTLADGVFMATNERVVTDFETTLQLTAEEDPLSKDFIDQQQETSVFSLQTIYETKDGSSIFTQDHLKAIRAAENKLWSTPGLENYCWKANGVCVPMYTPMDFFLNNNGDIVSTPQNVINYIITSNATLNDSLTTFVSKDFTVENPVSDITRDFIQFGFPLEGYTDAGMGEYDTDDDYLDQVDKLADFEVNVLKPVLEEIKDDLSSEGITYYWFSMEIFSDELQDLMMGDILLLILSFFIVGFIIALNTQSFFLTAFGLTHIVFSYPLAYFVYGTVFGYSQFPGILNMGLFVVLGIGADDIFVMVDAWTQSHATGPIVNQSPVHKLAYVYRRAAKAMLVTTFTTFAAFVSTAFSPIPAVMAFGIFSALLVGFNYLAVVTWFPAALMIYSKHFEYRKGFCYSGRWVALPTWHWKYTKCARENSVEKIERGGAGEEKDVALNVVSPTLDPQYAQTAPHLHAHTHAHDNDNTMGGLSPGLSYTEKERQQSLPALPAANGPSSPRHPNPHKAAKDCDRLNSPLSPPRTPSGKAELERGISFAGDDHTKGVFDKSKLRPTERFFADTLIPFLKKTRHIILIAVFVFAIICLILATQLEPPSKADYGVSEDTFLGRSLYLSTEGFLASGVGFVNTVRLVFGVNGLDRSGYDMNDPIHRGHVEFDHAFSFKTAAEQESVHALVSTLVQSPLTIGSTDYTTLGLFRQWRASRGLSVIVNDPEEFTREIVYFTRNVTGETQDIGVGDNGEIKWVMLSFNSSVAMGAKNSIHASSRKEWESVVNAWKSEDSTPATLHTVFAANENWAWAQTSDVIIRVAMYSVCISVALAFAVMIAATLNIAVSSLALSAIVCVVAISMGLMKVFGWTLGYNEALCVTILVGLSCDFICHYSEAYVQSPAVDRTDRTEYAYATMGISITGAFLTTFMSVVSLFFAFFVFFNVFGMFVATAMGVAYVISNTYLPALFLVVGPQNNAGSLVEMWRQKTIFPLPSSALPASSSPGKIGN